MRTVIEVGANTGTDTENFLNSGDKVFAFEPTPELILQLQQKFGSNPNFFLIPMAVDTKNGWAKFNVAGQGDWGCSSLYEFSDNIHEKWPGRPDFKTTHSYTVMTIRLDTFIQANEIKTIDFLWIDAQGNDFNVLKSIGEYIHLVKEGKCEGSYTVDLYSNTNNNVFAISEWLKQNGFKTTIVPDDVSKEANITFYRE